MFQGQGDPGDSSHLPCLLCACPEESVCINSMDLVAQVIKASGSPSFTSTAHAQFQQTGLAHLQNRSRTWPSALPSSFKPKMSWLKPGFRQHPSLGISVSCLSSTSVFQIQLQGCFEGKCQIMSLLCSKFPKGSLCHSSYVSSGVPQGPTGSSTYSLLEVNSPTPSLVSTLIHVFLVPHSFPLCSNLRGFCCCCCAS